MLDFKPRHLQTNIGEGIRYLTSAIKKRSITFLISDFLGAGYEDAMKIAARKHDFIGVRLYDPRESTLPKIGLMHVVDAETGETVWVDAGDGRIIRRYADWWKKKADERSKIFRRNGVDVIDIRIDQSYIRPLINFFRARGKRW